MQSYVHVCGIGGIGTSGIALLLAGSGKRVRGTDIRQSCITDALFAYPHHIINPDSLHSPYSHFEASHPIEVALEPHPEWAASAEWVSLPAHFPEQNPEFLAAREHNVELCTRNASLLRILDQQESVTAVIGTLTKALTAKAIARFSVAFGEQPWGWCVGAASRLASLDHAAWANNMSLELDEREDLSAWIQYRAQSIVISDWQTLDLGYYGKEGDASQLLCNILEACKNNGREVVWPVGDAEQVLDQKCVQYEVWTPHITKRFTFSIDCDQFYVRIHPLGHDIVLTFQGSRLEGEALCAALSFWLARKETVDWSIIQKVLNSMPFVGWFAPHKFGVHDIRMHPVTVRAVLSSLAESFREISVLIRPYPQTMRLYSDNHWGDAFQGTSRCILLPPYEGAEVAPCHGLLECLRARGVCTEICQSQPEAWTLIENSSVFPWLVLGGDDLIKV